MMECEDMDAADACDVNVTSAFTAGVAMQRQVGGSLLQLYRTSYAARSAFLAIAALLFEVWLTIVVDWRQLCHRGVWKRRALHQTL